MIKLEKLDRRHGVLPTSQRDNEDSGTRNDDSASKSRRGRGRVKMKCGRIILLVVILIAVVVSAITTGVILVTNTLKRGTPLLES